MKKLFLFSAFVCLLLTGAVFAQQKAANFAGSWELDAAKSKLPERMRVESMTLNVAQTDKQLKVETNVKRAPRPEGEMPNGGNGGAPPMPMPDGGRGIRQGNGTGSGVGGGRGGMTGGGSGTVTYNLDGNETINEPENPAGSPSVSTRLKAETEKDGKLKLTSLRSFETQMGAMTVKTTENWELIDNGKSLKITRETETPRGAQTSEMYFTRKAAGEVSVESPSDAVYQAPVNNNTTGAPQSSVKMITGGVLNGKATSMPQPEYPAAARAVQASGTVNVQVTLDEQGKVVAANAVSGHPLLRAAAESAARKAEFAPTMLSGIPVKVKGILTYNFVL